MLTAWAYDVWGNEEDGWEVNNKARVYTFDNVDEIPEIDEELLGLFILSGVLSEDATLDMVEFDGDDMVAYATDVDSGFPLGEIVKED